MWAGRNPPHQKIWLGQHYNKTECLWTGFSFSN